MRFIFNLIGEFDLWGERVGKILGLLMFHITISSLTGGLWLFWLAYKFFIKKEIKECSIFVIKN